MNEALKSLSADLRKKLRKKAQPGFVGPMKATLVHEHFSDPNWIFERKLDGERCLLHRNREGKSFLSEACRKGWEGLMVKEGE